MDFLEQLLSNIERGPYYEQLSIPAQPLESSIRLIAYYLPQYHPIPENDIWWGRGFTEWTNVSKAFPKFEGHYQPHLPGELGFYDLRLPEVLKRQVELARIHGIYGFCFHHYWFGGDTLLDTPIKMLLNHPEINISYCVNWANESWTRRWDGKDEDILIEQRYSAANDIAFAISLEPFFRDPRYIRVNGRPLLMVYRPKLLPNPSATVARWRAHFESVGLGNPYVVMAQGFGDHDPRPYGIDAAAGFPPHNSGFEAPEVQADYKRYDPSYSGRIIQYSAMVSRALSNTSQDFRLFPGVCPSWDNDARKPGRGFSIIGSSPTAYGEWLTASCDAVLNYSNDDEKIVFINAWNEWGEGAHLEPDRHLGYAYLSETARVVASFVGAKGSKSRESDLQVPLPPVRRKFHALPRLISKNLAHHTAHIAERLARRLRRLT